MSAQMTFAAALACLRDVSRPLPPVALYAFSDLGAQEMKELAAVWPDAPVARRRNLINDLGELAEANIEVAFNSIFRLALEDDDAQIRAAAIANLWEDQSPDLIVPLLEFMRHDPAVEVRAAAAGALGNFVYLGEIEELPAEQARRIEAVLLEVINGNDDVEVRRRALEASAFASRPEVAPLIRAAYAAPDEKWRISAVCAMGRTADPVWAPEIKAALEHGTPEMRFEAARAAGELELAETVPALESLLTDDDTQCREAAIWSLSQMGGPEARRALLRLLAQTEDEIEADFIEEALENLAFTDDVHDLLLFDWDAEEER